MTTHTPPSLTAPLTVSLATPATLQAGLWLLGFVWDPVPIDEVPWGVVGLYVWVARLAGLALTRCPVLYSGVGRGRGGVVARVTYEQACVGPDACHGHGMVMHGYDGRALGGPVRRRSAGDLAWRQDYICPRGVDLVDGLLGSGRPDEAVAEQVAIRLAMYTAGGFAPPCNSHYAGAWDTDAGAAWAAWAAARKLAA
jgi:hypothetical protein